MHRHLCPMWLVVILFAGSLSGGNEPPGNKAAPPRPAKASPDDKLLTFTVEREAAALTFARLHHADLVDLLYQLKDNNTAEYERAVRELFRVSETLAQTQDRDPRRYELDLKVWKLDSRIRLFAARLGMAHSQKVEDELKQALLEQVDVRLEQQLLQRERMAARLDELDATIEKTREGKQQQVEKRFGALMRSVAKSQSGAASRPNPAVSNGQAGATAGRKPD